MTRGSRFASKGMGWWFRSSNFERAEGESRSQRIHQHRERKHPESFTARYTFDRLVYYEMCGTEAEARAREMQIKKWNRSKKISLIERMNPNWQDLAPDVLSLLRLD